MKKPVPASYAQMIYHAKHAFRLPRMARGVGRYRFGPRQAALS